jgi:hypothetical protein
MTKTASSAAAAAGQPTVTTQRHADAETSTAYSARPTIRERLWKVAAPSRKSGRKRTMKLLKIAPPPFVRRSASSDAAPKHAKAMRRGHAAREARTGKASPTRT